MLSAKNLGYEVGGNEVFSNVNFSISDGDKAGLIGPNGAGKTTLLNILACELEETSGEVVREDVEVGLLPQDLSDWLDHNVYAFLEEVNGIKAIQERYNDALKDYEAKQDDNTLVLFCDAAEKLGDYGVATFEGRAVRAMFEAGLSDDFIDREIGSLSGGERTRVALAAIMSAPYDVIMLDEPTNNLDLEGMVILEKFIEGSNASFLVVSHDRRFLRNATSRIIELLGGDKGVNQYGLGYDEYVAARVAAYEADRRRYERHVKDVRSLEQRIRNTKIKGNSAESGAGRSSDGDKLTANYRSSRAAGHLASQASAMASRLEKMKDDAPHKPQEPISLEFMFPEADTKANLLRVHGLTVKYDDVVYGPYNLSVRSGDRIGVFGPNGSGKTTLIKAILGEVDVESGGVLLSDQARIGYIDQNQTIPDLTKTPVENLRLLNPSLNVEDAIYYLRRFYLDRDQAMKASANTLSGGERAKVLLASIASKRANLLLLDEPTNNLDIPTIEGLQEALASYNGAVILVSHDRDFIDGVGINSVIKLKGRAEGAEQ